MCSVRGTLAETEQGYSGLGSVVFWVASEGTLVRAGQVGRTA